MGKYQFTKLLLAAVVLALTVIAAGCGGSKSANDATSTAAGSTTTAAGRSSTGTNQGSGRSQAAFRSCLAAHGVKLPAGGFGRPQGGQPPAGTTGGQPPAGATGRGQGLPASQRKAFAACQSKLPAGSGFPGRPGGGKTSPALAKYTTCLRKHGVRLGQTNNRAAFAKASAACAKLAPKAGSNG